mmetsp:Transcript_24187/g.60057  ORF Transcript_24187/g.60057 Transcript_24187/m.60057 type:complete len:86 (-) Transcript_24187:2400-2657(-)
MRTRSACAHDQNVHVHAVQVRPRRLLVFRTTACAKLIGSAAQWSSCEPRKRHRLYCSGVKRALLLCWAVYPSSYASILPRTPPLC